MRVLGLWGSAFAGAIRVWITTFFGKNSTLGSFLNTFLDWFDVDDWRPLAALLPNYMKGIRTVPECTRLLRVSLKEAFKDHLPPGNNPYLDHRPKEEKRKNCTSEII